MIITKKGTIFCFYTFRRPLWIRPLQYPTEVYWVVCTSPARVAHTTLPDAYNINFFLNAACGSRDEIKLLSNFTSLRGDEGDEAGRDDEVKEAGGGELRRGGVRSSTNKIK